MKKSCLYISLFTRSNHYDCLGLSYQINNDLLCIFSDEEYYYLYSSLLFKYGNKIKIINDDPSILELIGKLKQEYSHVVLLHNTKFIIEHLNITNILNKSTQPDTIHNLIDENNKTAITIIPMSCLNELSRNNITMFSIIMNPKNILKDNSNIRLSNYYPHAIIPEIQYKKNKNIFYEDNNCIFAIFDQKNSLPLLKSPCYINKHNQRIYSTTNSCAGEILSSSNDEYHIKWSYNNMIYDCKYNYDKETEQFI